jgi:type I restriction enzyme S subunit
MPTYTCEKCARVFKQKSGYDDHVGKKKDCSTTTNIDKVVTQKVKEVVSEAVRAVVPNLYAPLELSKDPIQREAELQKFFEALHNLLWNKAGLNPEKALENLTFWFAYRMIEIQADYLSLPTECRWTCLASHKNENDTYETMKKGCVSFQKNPVTKPFFKKPEIEKADVIFEIIQQINRIPLEALQQTDTLGNIFEYMLGRGMSTMSDEGQYFTNREICKLAFKKSFEIKPVLRREDGSLCTFADWFCGTGGFAAEYVKGVKDNITDIDWQKETKAIYCQDMNLSSVTTTLLNLLILTGVPFSSTTIRSGNSFTDPITVGASAPHKGLSIDFCFMNPPYGGDKSKGKEYKFAYSKKVKDAEGNTSKKFFVNQEIQSIGIEDDDKVSAGVQLGMATLADGGVAAIVLPQGFFFGASKKCIELRKKLAEEYKIHYVVDIASGAFKNTGTKTSMIIFQKGVGPTEFVTFIGLDETELWAAELEELREKNYSLNYKQYVKQEQEEMEGFEMVKLGDICEINFGERITKKDNIGTLYPVYGGGNDTFRTDKKNRDGITCKVSRFGISEHNCVQIIHGDYWLMDSGFTITAKESKATSSYIWNWLLQNKKAVYQCGRATAQMNMDMETFKSLQLPLPSLERQEQIVEAIDGWAILAQQEETALKLLEKQLMFQVKEMGRGKEKVKLEALANNITFGFMVASGDYGTEGVPVIKTKNIKSKRVMYPADDQKIQTKLDEKYKIRKGDMMIVLGGSPGENGIWEYDEEAWLNQDCAKITIENPITKMFVFYSLQGQSYNDYIESNTTKTTIGHVSRGVVREIEIHLPSLIEQETLKSDFDEISHKHTKISEYKAKAQEAIQRLIPGASE